MRNAIVVSFAVTFTVLAFFMGSYIEFFCVILDAFFSEGLGIEFDVMAVVFLVLLVALCVWFGIYAFKHRKKDELIEVVELKCPDDMNPVEVGFLVDGVVDSEDISALLVYWASKNYIEISGEGNNQVLKRLQDLPKDAKGYERKLFSDIFKDSETVPLSLVKERAVAGAQQTVSDVEKVNGAMYFDKKVIRWRQVFLCLFALLFFFSISYFWLETYYYDSLVYYFSVFASVFMLLAADWHLKYYDYRHKNAKKGWRIFSFVVLILVFALVLALSIFFFFFYGEFWADQTLAFVVLVLELAMFLCAVLLSKNFQIYTQKGWKKLGEMLGLRQYLSVVEKDRIKMLVEEQPNIFYEVLPYAYVLGVSDKWIKDFNVISAYLEQTNAGAHVLQIGAAMVVWDSVFSGMRGFRVPRNGFGVSSGGGPRGGGPRGGGGHGGGHGGGFGGFGGGGVRR